MLVCMGEYEQHILCLDARPVTAIKIATHRSSERELGCALPPESSDENNASSILKLDEKAYSRYYVGGLFLTEKRFG